MRLPDRAADHVELRRDLQVEIFLGVILTILAAGCGIFEASPIRGMLWFATSAYLGTVTTGVWFAKEWARWGFGVLAVGFATLGVANVIMNFTASLPVHKVVGWVVGMIFWGCVAAYMFQPSTRQAFTSAREAILKARASSAGGEGPSSRRPTLG